MGHRLYISKGGKTAKGCATRRDMTAWRLQESNHDYPPGLDERSPS
jgi:hypothetical protein